MQKKSKNVENASTQMRRGVLELCILSLLAKQEAYTNDIVSTLKEVEMIVVEGSVYPLLTRLKNQGYLKYRWVESQQGPPRKYFEITPEGSEYLEQLRSAWLSLVETVGRLL